MGLEFEPLTCDSQLFTLPRHIVYFMLRGKQHNFDCALDFLIDYTFNVAQE